MYLPFLTFSPIGIIDGGLWPGEKWLPSPEMKRKMNDFMAARASEAWDEGVLTLWQIHWPWQPNLDRPPGDVGVARVHCGSFADVASAHSLFLLQSWCPARRTVESGSRPASRSFRAQRFYRCEGALSGNVEAKRTCAARWEAPAGDFIEHCRRPGFPGWNKFFPCRLRA